MKKWIWLLGGLAVLGLVAAGVVALMVQRALEPVDPGAGEEAARIVDVLPGDSVVAVGRRLEEEGLLKNAQAFRWLARYRELDGSLKVGEYRISPAMTPEQILRDITEGRVVTYEVVLPEGFTLLQIAERLADADLVDHEAFLSLARDPEWAARLGVEGDTLEGYLFPETYRLPKGLSTQEVAGTLVDQFLAVWKEIQAQAKEDGFSMQQVVTLASIIEKETGAPQERPMIASVFLNRMDRGMRLETDPTVIYGLGEEFDGNLLRRHLEDGSNRYNTYKIKGLPPGPIANPGRAALHAVVNPAETEYLFFVSRNDGTHIFTRTYAEHSREVDRYQRRGR